MTLNAASHHDLGFARAVLAGLEAVPRAMPSEWLADEVDVDRVEAGIASSDGDASHFETLILDRCAREIASEVGPGAHVVVWGGGMGAGVDRLLAALEAPRLCMPIDASALALAAAAQHLKQRFPTLSIHLVARDFMRLAALPCSPASTVGEDPTLVVVPARRIGSIAPDDAAALLRRIASMAGARTRLVVGTPLLPHASTSIETRHDAAGLASGPGLRLLARINRELGGDFDPAGYREELRSDATGRRCDCLLVSRTPQRVRVLGRLFEFGAGETIHVGRTYRHGLSPFEVLAEAAGWGLCQRWVDAGARCAVHVLALNSSQCK
ncbi:MAG: L-histidine N(alpha)-methyltransferase [Caldimonas sp.]